VPGVRAPHKGLRYLCFCLVLIGVAVYAAAYWLPAEKRYFDYHTRSHGYNWDFRVYYAAGRDWSLGMDPYASQWLSPTVQSAVKPIRFKDQRTLRFIYPPTLLPVYRWIAHLPYRKARVDWRDLNFVVLAAAGLVAVFLERGRRLEVAAALLLLSVLSFPVLYHVREGNIDMIVAGLATSGFLLYGRARSWPSAVLLALAAVTKVTPLLVVVALVVYYRDWRFAAKTALILGAVVGVSLAFVPLHFYREAAAVLFLRSQSMPGAVNQSLMRWLHRFPTAPRYASFAAYACLLGGLAWMGRRAHADARAIAASVEAPDVLVFSLAVLVMLLFTPIAWIWTYVWVIVPAAMLLMGRQRLSTLWARLVLLGGVALMSAPIRPRGGPILDSLTMIGGGVALACLIAYVVTVPAAAPGGPAAESLRARSQGAVAGKAGRGTT
jgi:hypothetical protein